MYTVEIKETAEGSWRGINSTIYVEETVYCAGRIVSNECLHFKSSGQNGHGRLCLGKSHGEYCRLPLLSRSETREPESQSETAHARGVRIVDATDRTIWLFDVPAALAESDHVRALEQDCVERHSADNQ